MLEGDFFYDPHMHPTSGNNSIFASVCFLSEIQTFPHRLGQALCHTWSRPNMSWNKSDIRMFHVHQKHVSSVFAKDNIATALPKWVYLSSFVMLDVVWTDDVFPSRPSSSSRFSPDGKRISFLCDETGYLNLWLADSDGSNAVCKSTGPTD